MCGAIGIFASAEKNSVRSMRRPLLYNIGRVLSYTLTGGIVGAIGSVFSIDMKIRGIIILIAGFFMLLMSLSMLGLAGFHLPTFFAGKFTRVGAGAFLVGLLNGFMPCGPLQAMQLYALSAGGFFKGALSMFLFALGTVPLMLSSGALINLTHGKTRVLIGKIASVLILVLSVSMLNRGFLGLGIDVSVALPKKYDGYTAAVIGDGVQIVSLELDFDSFGDMVVQKGIPVTVFLHADEGKITGCNNEVVCADLGFDVHITPGDNIPHISFNTCQNCSPSPKAYYVQKEDVLQCANCGSVFAPEDIGLIHGGCNPWPIEEVQIGDESIVIPVASLDSMRNKFTTWKGPTE